MSKNYCYYCYYINSLGTHTVPSERTVTPTVYPQLVVNYDLTFQDNAKQR